MALSDFLPLAGVLIGAGATGGVQFAHERRKEKRDLKVAARLTWDALFSLRLHLTRHQHKEQPISEELLDRAESAWEKYNATLAGHLKRHEWDKVQTASELPSALRPIGTHQELSDEAGGSYFDFAGEVLTEAIDVLELYR